IKLREKPACLEQFEQDNVTHAEAKSREVHFAATDQLDEIIIASAAGDGAQLAFAVKCLKHHARIVGQPANNVIINRHKILQPARSEVVQNKFQFSSRLAFLNKGRDFLGGKTQRDQFGAALLGGFGVELVDGLIEFVSPGRVATVLGVKVLPGIAAAQPDEKIIGGQAEGAQGIDEQRDQFGVRREVRLAEDVGVELEVFAHAALLLALVAEELGDGEPLDGLLVIALVRRRHAREGGGHLRA